MGTFDGLTIGSTGLHAQRRGVEVAGQNIANVNTDGYSRQRVDINAASGPDQPAFFSTWDGTGLGVRSVEITRVRDQFIDKRVRDESAGMAKLSELQNGYTSIERIFGEPSDTALSATLGDFYAAWDDVANRPDDISVRTQLVERSVTLMSDLDRLRSSLQGVGDVAGSRIESLVAEVNATAIQIAEIQDAIASAVAAGLDANGLMDQRDALVDQLTSTIGGTVRPEDDGTVTIFLGGTPLVRGRDASAIDLQVVAGEYQVIWPADARPVDTGGKIAGLLQVANELVPRYLDELSTVADELASTVNTAHNGGFDNYGNAGLDFFVPTVDGGWAVHPDILADPHRVAAANAAGTYDGSVAQQIAGLENTNDSYRRMIVQLGVESQATIRRGAMQQMVVNQVVAEQQAVSGVNLDEELTDLVRFQRAFEANSRFISSVDEMLDVLINGTGRVGR